MTNRIIEIIILVILSLSLIVNAVLGIFILNQNQELKENRYRKINFRILEFRDMFVKNIVLGDKEVDFDTRLEMETAVRNLNDKEVLTQWQKFTESQTKEEVNLQAEQLLNLLIQKTTIESR